MSNPRHLEPSPDDHVAECLPSLDFSAAPPRSLRGPTFTGGFCPCFCNVLWDDAGGSASKLWSDFGNWSPDGSPASDDVFVGVGPGGGIVAAAADDVTLVDQNFTIDSLTIGNGADVDTQGNELIVNALTLIEDTGSRITVRPRSMPQLRGSTLRGSPSTTAPR